MGSWSKVANSIIFSLGVFGSASALAQSELEPAQKHAKLYFSGRSDSLGLILLDEKELLQILSSNSLRSETQADVEAFFKAEVSPSEQEAALTPEGKAHVIQVRAIQILRELRALQLARPFEQNLRQNYLASVHLAEMDQDFADSIRLQSQAWADQLELLRTTKKLGEILSRMPAEIETQYLKKWSMGSDPLSVEALSTSTLLAMDFVVRQGFLQTENQAYEWSSSDLSSLESTFFDVTVDPKTQEKVKAHKNLGALDPSIIYATLTGRTDALISEYQRNKKNESSLRVAKMAKDQWPLVATTGSLGIMWAGSKISKTKTYQAIEYGARHPVRTCKIVLNAIGKWLWHPVDEPYPIKPRTPAKEPGKIRATLRKGIPFGFMASAGALGFESYRAYQGESYIPSLEEFVMRRKNEVSPAAVRESQMTALREDLKDNVNAVNEERFLKKLPLLEVVMLETWADKSNPHTEWMTYAYAVIKVKEPSLDLPADVRTSLRQKNIQNGLLIRFAQYAEGENTALAKELGIDHDVPAQVFWKLDASVNLQSLKGSDRAAVEEVLQSPEVFLDPELAPRLFSNGSSEPF